MSPSSTRRSVAGHKHLPTVPHRRRGAIIVLAAFLMVALMALLALSIDVGFILTAHTDLQRSIDAGALAGAGAIVQGVDFAKSNVREYIKKNWVVGHQVSDDDIDVKTGHWDPDTQTFTEDNDLPNAVWATATARDLPLFFGPIFNRFRFTIQRDAVAMYQPREIEVVLDFSASMNDDSELRSVGKLGANAIVAGLQKIWNELGAPTYGTMTFTPVYLSSTNSSTLKSQLGLTYVPYPYPAGSWNDYFSYVQSSSYLYNAGYRQKYGMLTLVNYWLERYPAASQTPVLWQTSEQPVTAVKDALALFLAYIQEVYTEDQVGLVVYTYTDGMAIQETSLTKDFTQVQDLAKHRQAGHYTSMTNIGDGLKEARLDLQNHARAGAFKMIVLMTDGLANLPGSDPSGYLLQQAQLCADARYPVITISLGAGADTSIMQQVADITGGAHFNVPGGATVGAYDEQLRDTFRQIADSRPLKIVK